MSGRPDLPPLLALAARAPLVGRHDALIGLAEAWATSRAGARQVVVVVGEAGIGKTRLAAALAAKVASDGGRVLYGRCDAALAAPYEPFVEALEHDLAGDDFATTRLGPRAGELARLAPHLAHRLPEVRSSATDPATQQYFLFEAVSGWLRGASASGGALLVVEDLHWATTPTLLLLNHVVKSVTDVPLLVLATCRDDVDRSHPLTATLADLWSAPGVERLALGGLPYDELAELVTLSGDHDLELASRLHADTDGNPFYALEVLRNLAETGDASGPLPVPEGVRDVVRQRVARLGARVADALSCASVIGREFELGVLAGATGIDVDELTSVLDLAVGAGLLEEAGPQHFRFAHALTGAAVLDELAPGQRARLHLRIGEQLERVRPDDVRPLAHHFSAAVTAGGTDRAITYRLRAARRALDQLAHAEALELATGAIALLDGVADADADPGLRLDLDIVRGEAQRRVGDQGYRLTLLEASRQARQLGDRARQVAAVLANSRGMTSVISAVDHERLAEIEHALDAVGPEPSADRAQLLALLAQELSWSPDDQRRLALADEAIATATALGDDAVLAAVEVRSFLPRFTADRAAQLAADGPALIARCDAVGDPQLQVLSRAWVSRTLVNEGRLREAEARIRAALAIAEEINEPTLLWVTRAWTAMHTVAAGRLDEAEREVNDAFATGQAAGEPDAIQWWAAQMVGMRAMQGRVADVIGSVAGFADQFDAEPAWKAGVGLCLGFLPDQTAAFDFQKTNRVVPADIRDGLFRLHGYSTLAVIAWQLKDEELARLTLDAALPFSGHHAHSCAGYTAPIDASIGVCLAVLGELDQAIAFMRAARAQCVESGIGLTEYLVDQTLAETLVERDAPGDRDEAIAMLHGVIEKARYLAGGESQLTEWGSRMVDLLERVAPVNPTR